MALVELAPSAYDDLDRVLDHLAKFEVTDAPARIEGILEILGILTHSPLIGRAVGGGRRELVIGVGARGFVATYRFVARADTVVVVATRNQREFGHRRGG